jgi:hypothetical protein
MLKKSRENCGNFRKHVRYFVRFIVSRFQPTNSSAVCSSTLKALHFYFYELPS